MELIYWQEASLCLKKKKRHAKQVTLQFAHCYVERNSTFGLKKKKTFSYWSMLLMLLCVCAHASRFPLQKTPWRHRLPSLPRPRAHPHVLSSPSQMTREPPASSQKPWQRPKRHVRDIKYDVNRVNPSFLEHQMRCKYGPLDVNRQLCYM